ncbi:MAG: hypothetical protein NWE95_11740 [Candidatus Bathyarchaeota archaeon]|nr:hypothetical protein [Candidatus Bathyarchaeota archaeon]
MSDKINDQILKTLKEMLKWLKFSGVKEVRTVMSSALETEQKRLVFHLSDGNRGIIEIGKLANVGSSTVARYWEAWYRLGLMEPISVKGGVRYKKAFELEDFGFNVPQMKTSAAGQGEATSQTLGQEGETR